jgi:hypothetical protein
MKTRCLISLAALGLLSACAHNSMESQIPDREAALARFSLREQSMIKRGLIAVGFTQEMVYLALAKPDRVVTGPGPQQESWFYTAHYAADGSSLIPAQRIVTHWASDTGGLGATSSPSGPVHRMPGSPPNAPTHPELNTFTVEYDPTLFQERTQANNRITVIFLRGVVADIRVETT